MTPDPDPVVPDPLTVDSIVAAWTDTTVALTIQDPTATLSPTAGISVDAALTVTFSSSVQTAWLTNESLVALILLVNGVPDQAVSTTFSTDSDRRIFIEPAEPLMPGTTYQLIVNEGHVSVEGATFMGGAMAGLETPN